MATINSTQIQKLVDKRASGAHAPLETLEQAGKVRYSFGSATTPAVPNAADEFVMLELPTNCRVVRMVFSWASAMAGNNTPQVKITRDAYTSVAADGTQSTVNASDFISNQAVNGATGFVEGIGATNISVAGSLIDNATAPVAIRAICSAGALTAGKSFTVSVWYVVE